MLPSVTSVSQFGGLGRGTAAPPTVRSAPPAVSAIAEPPAFTYQPDPAARLVAPPVYAEAALARAEYRASLFKLADRPILDRLASPRPRFEAPAAEQAERPVTPPPPPPRGGAMIRHLRSAPQARGGAAGALPGARPAPRRFASRAPLARLGSPDPSHQSPCRPSLQITLYLLTCIDVFSKKADVIPLKDREQSTVTTAFNKMLSSIGVPQTIYSDQGSEFKYATFQKLLDKHNITIIFALSHGTCTFH
jgi:hypothetical protein